MNPKIGRNVGKLGLTLRKNAPTFTMILSVVGVFGTAVLSARAAYKSVDSLDKHKKNIKMIHDNKDSFETEKEYNREVAIAYKDTAVDLAKAYWPAALAVTMTVAAIFATNSIQRKRYLAMAGMYSAVAAAYNEYRDRVKNKYGEEAERELYFNTSKEEHVTVELDKKGKEKTTVDVVMKPGIETDPTYSTLYISTKDKCWYYNNPEMTYYYLLETQKFLTQTLRTRGYLFLNEVLRALEKPEVPEGQVIGWVYDETKSDTDNCVDFGLKEGTENFDLFRSGKNDFLYITLNHDGTIYDKFPSFDRLWSRNPSGRV